MKPYVLPLVFHSIARRVGALVFCSCLAGPIAFGAGGIVDQSIDGLYNLHDQLQEVVMKSVKGVGDAMQEGPPPDTGGKPWSLQDLQQIQQKNQNLYDLNKTLAQNQQKLLNVNLQILNKLPPNDPRRAQVQNEIKNLNSGLTDSRAKAQDYKQRKDGADVAIDRWKQRNDSGYVPPRKPNPPPQTQDSGETGSSAPVAPTQPTGPTGPGPWSGPGPAGPVAPGPNLGALQTKEAALENAARNLGKEREAAVIDYLNNPTPENKAKAAALKQKLDGLVNKLNKVRGRVDGLTGGSRSPLKVRTASQIKKKWRQGGSSGGGPEDHHHGPGGTDVSSSENHHHGPGGTDAPYNTVSGKRTGKAARGSGSGRRAGANRQRQRQQVASSQSMGAQQSQMRNPNLQNPNRQNPNRQGRKRARNRYGQGY